MHGVVWLSLSVCLSVCALQENRARLTMVSCGGASMTVDASLWREHCVEYVLFESEEPQTTYVTMATTHVRLLNTLMMWIKQGVWYATLIDQLQQHPLIVSLFELIEKDQILRLTDPLFHVVAQAYVHKMVNDVLHGQSILCSPAKLCAYFECRYPSISACLNLYVYAALTRTEREKNSISLLQYVDIELAFAQLPVDARVVQFAQPDELSSNFAHLKSMAPSQLITLADRTGHMPFIYYGRRFVGSVRNLLFSGYWANDLLWACMLQDVARVKEILKAGISVLRLLGDAVDCLVVRVLRWCPHEESAQPADGLVEVHCIGYPSDPVLDEICRLVLARALDEDAEALRELLEESPELISRVQELMPELTTLFFQ